MKFSLGSHAVRKTNAVQMIYLVLKNSRTQSRKWSNDQIACTIKGLDFDQLGARNNSYNMAIYGKTAFMPDGIPNVIQKSGIRQGGAQDLSQAKPMPKQHNLNKLCDAGGLKDYVMPM